MSETRFTPGPWEVAPNAHGVFCIVQNRDCRVAVAHRNGEREPTREAAEANARLIAAAPDLYHALRAFDERGYTQAVGHIFRAALLKASPPESGSPQADQSNAQTENG